MSELKVYDAKAVISGNCIEFYYYDKNVVAGIDRPWLVGRSVEADDYGKDVNRAKVFNRGRTNVRRLINCNFQKCSKFLTLTFAKEMTDLQECNYEVNKFIKRLKTYLGYKVDYLCVPEIQEKRAIKYGSEVWHYHLILFNVLEKVDVDQLAKVWGNGFIKLNVIDHVDNVGAYVCKYMTKESSEKLRGQKMYFTSRGLKKPEEIKEPDVVTSLAVSLQSQAPRFENTFSNEHNTVSYKQYIITNVQE